MRNSSERTGESRPFKTRKKERCRRWHGRTHHHQIGRDWGLLNIQFMFDAAIFLNCTQYPVIICLEQCESCKTQVKKSKLWTAFNWRRREFFMKKLRGNQSKLLTKRIRNNSSFVLTLFWVSKFQMTLLLNLHNETIPAKINRTLLSART